MSSNAAPTAGPAPAAPAAPPVAPTGEPTAPATQVAGMAFNAATGGIYRYIKLVNRFDRLQRCFYLVL